MKKTKTVFFFLNHSPLRRAQVSLHQQQSRIDSFLLILSFSVIMSVIKKPICSSYKVIMSLHKTWNNVVDSYGLLLLSL